MKDEKKSINIGGLRISEYASKEYRKALKYYGVSRPDFCRGCIERLIEHYQNGDPIALPIEFKVRTKRESRM